jgi:hypothetical protein
MSATYEATASREHELLRDLLFFANDLLTYADGLESLEQETAISERAVLPAYIAGPRAVEFIRQIDGTRKTIRKQILLSRELSRRARLVYAQRAYEAMVRIREEWIDALYREHMVIRGADLITTGVNLINPFEDLKRVKDLIPMPTPPLTPPERSITVVNLRIWEGYGAVL